MAYTREHEHKLFMYNVKTVFEPATDITAPDGSLLYRAVEYAYLVCNCGYVEKAKANLKRDHD